jgi:hypothetical protein
MQRASSSFALILLSLLSLHSSHIISFISSLLAFLSTLLFAWITLISSGAILLPWLHSVSPRSSSGVLTSFDYLPPWLQSTH